MHYLIVYFCYIAIAMNVHVEFLGGKIRAQMY